METTAVIYRIILLGHIGSAIVGFGALITHGSHHARAVRSEPAEAATLLQATAKGAKLAEYGLYGLIGFGIVLVSLSDDVYRFSEPWVAASIVVWLLVVGLTHGLVRPARSQLQQLSSVEPGGDPVEAQLVDREDAQPVLARLAIGEAATQLLLVGALVLMIWKPGH